jgi:RNA12 protein/RNA recognition motif. (a.k.a. RRM, RBD, or RNP domain)
MLSSRLLPPARQCSRSHSTLRQRSLTLVTAHRPALRRTTLALGRRGAASETGEDDSGHIKTKQNEGILFFDNIFPLKLQWLSRIPFFNPDQSLPALLRRVNNPNVALADPTGIVQRALPSTVPLKITDVIPRVREGGAYVKFSHDSSITAEELESTVKAYMLEKPIRPWFNPLRRVRAFLVRGKPWIEDLHRLPSSRLKIEFLPTSPETSAAELTQERLYTLFRRYGKLAQITPQPFDSKALPKYAVVEYDRMRFASMAKNCMHGFVVGEAEGGGKAGTVLKMSYEPKYRGHTFWDWLTNHPRIVLPILVALLTSVGIAIFDPIRVFYIKVHVTHGLNLGNYKDWIVVKWIRSQISKGYDLILHRRKRGDDESLRIVWEDRKDDIQQLRTWLIETADTFIVVQGPRGAGKKELVMEEALKDRPNKLVIDCKRVLEARGDSATIAAAAAEVGYRPVFSWMNSISSMIDLAAMGTIGAKTGFSETVDNQLAKIWNSTATALKQIALSYRRREDNDAELGDDDWLDAHPEYRPVVIIDNFLHKSNEGNVSMVYDKLAEWGARLTSSNIAHVIFLTTDVSFSKSLSKALPDRVFRQITLGDCTPEVAKKMVLRYIDADNRYESSTNREEEEDSKAGETKQTSSRSRSDLDELDSVIQVLGGRLTDLEFLARRIQGGESPGSAVRQIIEQSASEILKMYLLDVDTSGRKWSPQQAWFLIKELAANGTLKYNELLLNSLLSNGEAVLQSLEQAELITITSKNGRPQSVKPGKPVYHAAFEYLTEDEVLKARLDLAILTELIAAENKNLDKAESELKVLAELPIAADLKPRIRYLLAKVLASQQGVEKMEQEAGMKKKIMKEKF